MGLAGSFACCTAGIKTAHTLNELGLADLVQCSYFLMKTLRLRACTASECIYMKSSAAANFTAWMMAGMHANESSTPVTYLLELCDAFLVAHSGPFRRFLLTVEVGLLFHGPLDVSPWMGWLDFIGLSVARWCKLSCRVGGREWLNLFTIDLYLRTLVLTASACVITILCIATSHSCSLQVLLLDQIRQASDLYRCWHCTAAKLLWPASTCPSQEHCHLTLFGL